MKNLIVAMALMFLAGTAAAEPYIQGVWTKGNPIYLSQGITVMPTSMEYDRTFTNIAVLYHPLSAGSIIPESWQVIIPPESWACTVGGSYAPNSGPLGAGAGVGCGLNLLDSVRALGSKLLALSRNGTMQAMSKQIEPGKGPLNLFASRQYDNTLLTPLKFAPRWFFGLGFEF